MIKELVQNIKEMWVSKPPKEPEFLFSTEWSRHIHRYENENLIRRRKRTNRLRNSLRLNSSTKNRTIRGIKTANNKSRRTYYKPCTDEN